MGLHSQRAILMRGDPGLFDILKKGIGFIAGQTPIGRGISTARDLLRRGQGPALPRFPGSLPRPPAGLQFPSFGPGAPGPATALAASGPMSGGCPKGFHANRSDYHTAAGFVARGTRCVRNRRRNLSNGRANTRALRRMTAWEKQDKKRRQTLAAIARSAK